MEQKQDLDDLIKNMVKEEGIESPSIDFTNNVMNALSRGKNESLVYKPLIPKSILFAAGAIIILSMTFLSASGYLSNTNSSSYLYKIINAVKIPRVNLQIPALFSYILGSALIMVMVQAFVLGGFFKKLYK
ncbi:MAG TPA: hypothetical protein VG847_16225 [Chitinophagaceae bacterium]|nr:hypothetical protein [Chitinophagaceae bacterium]